MTLFCVQVSGNHRLDDNKKEKERIKKQGFEVSSSKVEGRPTGPLRVWPGGLAMGRSLGDYEVPVPRSSLTPPTACTQHLLNWDSPCTTESATSLF